METKEIVDNLLKEDEEPQGKFGIYQDLILQYPKGMKIFEHIILSGSLERIWEKCMDMVSGEEMSHEEQEEVMETLDMIAEAIFRMSPERVSPERQ